MKKIAIFASGTGSNFQAIIDAIAAKQLQAEVALLVCDKPMAGAIDKAKLAGVPAFVFEPKQYESKAAFEQQIIHKLRQHEVDFVVLAGYMRLVGPTLLTAYTNRIINIHPSLLPAFPGKDAIGQAVKAGVKVTGVTIHFVDEGMDTGPIIAQRAMELTDGDGLADVVRKIHEIEHVFYPETLERLFGKGRV
ncbi:phosphoribosylglycinamide formyltransferase [Lederbergia lenta]|uniref:Phosphoribosylglycinamide formyltransferase n=1 Tax=Lederbergia lenta TaxID=1467 RepID=A0A2X4VRD0_LEDLE|nr:phosphoribosylglycinamide formyltransferase [Lederbergia lenta]MCM3110587.1 phosphoribosylglycinamide formyltransferase [Lederbergia lenta]MEC2325954.1 phosphoribosylglycinamide formyltransferase [Lederbergia lenta]SQI53451.1 phosphoribosylglycinamide formyltransferase [Lederbergia lenta]